MFKSLLAGLLILPLSSQATSNKTFKVAATPTALSVCGTADYKHNFLNQNVNEILENNKSLPLRRLVTRQSSFIPAGQSRRFLHMSPLNLDTQILNIKANKKNQPAVKVTVCAHANGKAQILDSFSVTSSASKTYKSLKNKRLSVRIQNPNSTQNADYEMDWKTPGEGLVWQPNKEAPKQAIKGFADIHVHQAADLAFAGGWYWGSHREGSIKERLPACDGHSHGTVVSGLSTGVKLLDDHEPQQYKKTHDWPHWDDIKHQQVGANDLKIAHDNGLGLMMVSLVNNQWLAGVMLATGQSQPDIPANDMDSVKLQLNSLWGMHENTDWYRIVRDPWEARRAVAKGQLPVVMAVEVDHLFPEGDGPWKEQLHDLYATGVRSIQLAHEVNTHFSGAAYHRALFKPMGQIKALFKKDIHFDSGDGVHNPLGMTALGYELIDEMIRLNMLIDVTHLSMVAQREIYAHVRDKYNGYPLYNSHTRFGPALKAGPADNLKEFVTTPETAAFIRRTGGVVGLRTGDTPTNDYKTKKLKPVKSNCDGTSRSLAQMYLAFEELGVSIALASDFNGFINQAGPRYGDEACARAPEAEREAQRLAQGKPPQGSALLQQFNTRGIGHMGLLPALMEDWQATGIDTRNVDQSAETFLKMWERAYDEKRQLLP